METDSWIENAANGLMGSQVQSSNLAFQNFNTNIYFYFFVTNLMMLNNFSFFLYCINPNCLL